MPVVVTPEYVEPFVAGLLGGIDVDGGSTPEQLQVLRAVVTHLWQRPDLDLEALEPSGPGETAAVIVDPAMRRRFHEILVALEACRHPLSQAQLDRVEAYCGALGVGGPDADLFRSFITDGAQRAADDFRRFLSDNLARRTEPALVDMPMVSDRPEPELAALLEALDDLPAGTLGHGLIEFYRRSGLPIPGQEASAMNHFFVAHDMTHVIAGLEPTGPGEVALSAFQMAMNDNSVNTSALLASLIVHEVGFGSAGKLEAEAGILADPAAAELFGRELARGAACTADFTLVDHLAIAHLPLGEVRARFGVRAPDDPADGHHHW
ncbi:MAG: hypothetical protein RI958_2337 [Actinomycetota bacterium]|jgi:hypothetical protein